MKIVTISDTHCHRLEHLNLPEGDVLIHSGDALSRGSYGEFHSKFIPSLKKIRSKFKHIIYIAGNHDIICQQNNLLIREELEQIDVTYLEDSEIVIDGVKFYGSPWTPRFGTGWAFQADVNDSRTPSERDNYAPFNDIQKYWDNIPKDTDVLITHGPPNGIMDLSVYSGENFGCPKLLKVVLEIKPKYHIFGHNHSGFGTLEKDGITFINTSICSEKYQPTQPFNVFTIVP